MQLAGALGTWVGGDLRSVLQEHALPGLFNISLADATIELA